MKRSLGWIAFASSVALTGCGSSPQEPEGGAPPVPPASSFVVMFDDFQTSPAAADVVGLVGPNWAGSAAAIGVWNVILTVTMVTPVAAFVAATNQTPVWGGDRWEWTFDFSVAGVGHSAVLLAAPTEGGHNWSMFISQDGGFTDFNWFNGFSQADGLGGLWTLNQSPADQTSLLDITWTRDATDGTGTIRYTNNITGSSERGGFIHYGRTLDPTYDLFYQISTMSPRNVTEIKWNSATKEGRVRDPLRFSDSEWHCWDAALDDIICQN